MQNLTILTNGDLGEIRAAYENNEPLFCLADICKILEIQDTYKVKQAILKEFELSTLCVGSFDTGYGRINTYSTEILKQIFKVAIK